MKTLIHSLVLRVAEHRRHKAFVKLALGGNSLPISFSKEVRVRKMKSIHLLSAVLLLAAAPFIGQQQLDQLQNEQQLNQLEQQQQFNQLQQQPDPLQRQQLDQLQNEQQLNQLQNEQWLNALERQHH